MCALKVLATMTVMKRMMMMPLLLVLVSFTAILPSARGKEIVVEGTGKVWVDFDMAVVSAVIEAEALDASGNGPQEMSALIQELLLLGIPRQNIRYEAAPGKKFFHVCDFIAADKILPSFFFCSLNSTTGYRVNHEYPLLDDEEYAETYIENDVEIFIHTGEGGGLLSKLLSWSQEEQGFHVHDAELFVSEQKEASATQEALDQAAQNARSKAETLAAAMDVTLGDVLLISDAPPHPLASEEEPIDLYAFHDDKEEREHGVEKGDTDAGRRYLDASDGFIDTGILHSHVPVGGGKFVTESIFLTLAIS